MLLDDAQDQCAKINGASTAENVHDMKGVPQSNVEDFVEPELTDELLKITVDASQ